MVNNSSIISDPYSISEDFTKFYKGLLACQTVKEIKIYKYTDKNVLIYLEIMINLPCRRSKMEVDIKEIEPIFLECSINEIMYKAPWVFSGRSDFPANKLPHTASVKNFPAYICLHRGNIDDWYIEHSVEDFINRIRTWFSDAASKKLIRQGDDFEPMIIYEDTGNAVYSYDKVTEFIDEYWNKNNGKGGFAYAICSFNGKKEIDFLNAGKQKISVQIIKIEEKKNLSNIIRNYNSIVDKKSKYFIGILVWSDKSSKYNEYYKCSHMSLQSLYEFNEKIGNEFKRALNILKEKDIPKYFLLLTAINRPTKLIGHSKNIDLLNFMFTIKKIKKHGVIKIEPRSEVLTLSHLEPLTRRLALDISNQSIDKNLKILIVGAGALGSKIIFHLARNGYTNLTIIDNDILSPHNLVRHALVTDSIGKNKAEEIVSKLNNMYLLDNEKSFKSQPYSFIEYAKCNDLSEYDILLDFSASKSVLSFISNFSGELPQIIIRAELADSGKLGMLLIEGNNRSVKVDEIQIKIFNEAILNSDISKWLKNYRDLREQLGESELEDITIGLGCNTNTMKLSDDIISYHASIFSNYIKKNFLKETVNGELLISHFDEDDYSKNYCENILIENFISIKADNKKWTIKIYNKTYNNILKELNKSSPRETGGILLGHVNIKNKIIYVIDVFIPKDNKSGPYLLEKGSKGTFDHLSHVLYMTGGMIKYVGDWHTHPNNSTVMSYTDKKSLLELKEHLKNMSYPAHIMIFNDTTFNSYVLD